MLLPPSCKRVLTRHFLATGMLISLYPRPFILPNTFALTPAAASRLIDRDFKWRDVFSLHFYDTDTDIVPKPWTVRNTLIGRLSWMRADIPFSFSSMDHRIPV